MKFKHGCHYKIIFPETELKVTCYTSEDDSKVSYYFEPKGQVLNQRYHYISDSVIKDLEDPEHKSEVSVVEISDEEFLVE